ncbi:RNA polymerase, sigma 28 subunit, SigD/FliA/WhiG [Saccharomonospora azurea SZMC 14600]|uniref:FliA/WhiG family RNA polymerase sigma factor n=1 Tax=Saccharomonospora azurea TaxID=40988 RepID=UPI00023FED90|nr:FliA/WhiG family RNA polymerase sigma factor [Saccharomonospora azurea]EHK87301.1 RNA polymerase, sigma 28 subunit, SigD/FliA/WhiG [Saccharomonospora azurea SZMC 14600]
MTRPTPVPGEAATADAGPQVPSQDGREGAKVMTTAPTDVGPSGPHVDDRTATSGAESLSTPVPDVAAPPATEPTSTANTDSAGADGVAEPTIAALWREFSRAPSQRVRDRLVLHYAPLVKYVAGRVGTGLPTHIDVADLIQSGIFGLVDAIEKFDPGRGLRFETYAMQRIRGAILDDLRSQDWVPRVVRSRAREVERAHERLGARLRRTPTDAEVAAELGISLRELRDLYGQLRLTSVLALDDLMGPNKESGTGSPADTLPDDDAVDPAAILVDQDNRKQLAEAVAQLNERDRIVVSLYYFENLTLAEIGKVLGVTESRVSQLHTRAVLRLRAKLVENAGS